MSKNPGLLLPIPLFGGLFAAGSDQVLPDAAQSSSEDLAMAVVTESCGGEGFEGSVRRGSSVLRFEACSRESQVWAALRDRGGNRLAEVRVHLETATFEYWIGGVRMNDTPSEDERQRVGQTLSAPEAALAGFVLPAVLDSGWSEEAEPVRALAASLVALEGSGSDPMSGDIECDPSPAGDCCGCCGPGCGGCTGCYTKACREHDICVRQYGHARCAHLFLQAALSAWCCRGVKIPGLC